MTGKHKHTGGLDEILGYLNDQLTERQRYALEREIERDPFLGEAFEGWAMLPTSELEKDLKSIDVVSGKIKKGINTWIPLSFAAGLLIIVGSVFWFMTREPALQQPVSYDPDVNPPMTATTPVNSDSLAIEGESGNALLAADSESPTSSEQNRDKKPEPKRASGIVKEGNTKSKTLETMKTIRTPDLSVTNEREQKSILEEPVREETDTAFRQNENATKSDTETLVVPTVEEKTLPVRRVGVHAEPEPLGGTVLYRDYLNKNVIFPEVTEPKKRETVRLRFRISELGEPFEFKIISSPGPSFSDEAIRAIRGTPMVAGCNRRHPGCERSRLPCRV